MRTRKTLYLSIAWLLAAAAPAAGQEATRAAIPDRTAARVEPGDRVVVKVAREPGLSETANVNTRGEIVLARIGTLDAARMTIRELEDTLRLRYGRFLRAPAVDVTVLRRIAVYGEVMKPDVYYLDLLTTVREAVATAGGITEFGDPSRVEVVRDGQRTRLADWQSGVTVSNELRSGDQIVVRQRPWLQRNVLPVASTAVTIVSLFIALRK